MSLEEQVMSSVRIVRGAVTGILADESFTIPTDEVKKCLEMARTVTKQFGQPSAAACVTFSSWLVGVLEEVVNNSVKRNGVINAEQLWSRYHELTISEAFKNGWEEFLDLSKVDKEPLFYQHVTDEVFEKLIQRSVSTESADAHAEQCEENDILLTYEEENAVTYVAGYVIHSLMQQKDKSCHKILEEFVNKNKIDQENIAEEWLKAVDRGGLTRITTDAFQLFYAIETCTRRHLTLSNTKQMDDSFRKHLTNCVLNDSNVLFYWCMAGQDEGDEDAQHCLEKIVEKWITIRGYSFANSMMEMYKQQEKKGTGKSKSLRSKLF